MKQVRANKTWRRWTTDEEKFVAYHTGTLSDAQIAKLLERTAHSVQNRRMMLFAFRSKKQQRASEDDVYKFVVSYKREWRNSPTFKEIRDGCGLSSTSVVRSCLDRLVDQGKIMLGRHGQYRSIRIVGARLVLEGEERDDAQQI